MKTFLTIEIVSFFIACVAAAYDASFHSGHTSEDGGWTIKYFYDRNARNIRNKALYFATALSLVGFLVLVWSY